VDTRNRRRISTGSPWEEQAGYSRALVVPDPHGDWIYVSGTTGFDYASMTIADDVIAQAEQCFRNIAETLARAGSSLADVVRVTYYLADRAHMETVMPVMGRHFGAIRPASTAVIAALIDPRMLIEIEVTARKAPGSSDTGADGSDGG